MELCAAFQTFSLQDDLFPFSDFLSWYIASFLSDSFCCSSLTLCGWSDAKKQENDPNAGKRGCLALGGRNGLAENNVFQHRAAHVLRVTADSKPTLFFCTFYFLFLHICLHDACKYTKDQSEVFLFLDSCCFFSSPGWWQHSFYAPIWTIKATNDWLYSKWLFL